MFPFAGWAQLDMLLILLTLVLLTGIRHGKVSETKTHCARGLAALAGIVCSLGAGGFWAEHWFWPHCFVASVLFLLAIGCVIAHGKVSKTPANFPVTLTAVVVLVIVLFKGHFWAALVS